ncbi:MAG: hypothetical protein ACI3V4_12995 [Faecousia sp.]
MNFPPFVAEWVAAYEQENGRKPSEKVLRIVTYFERLGIGLETLGYEDAKKGRKPLPLSVFYDLTRCVITDRTDTANETAQMFAEIIRGEYMGGYEKGSEV